MQNLNMGTQKAAKPAPEPPSRTANGEPSSSKAGEYMPIDLEYPGLKRVHERPPIYDIEGFLTEDECDSLVEVCSAPARG